MKKSLCGFLACTLLLGQFPGCASMPQHSRPVVDFSELEPSSIAPVSADSIDRQTFYRKIAELNGKIQKRHAGDTSFCTLLRQVEKLDDEWYSLRLRNWRIVHYSMYGGGILAMTPVIALATDAVKANPGSSVKFVLYLASLPFVFALGAGFGFLCTAGLDDSNFVVSHKTELVRLIDAYNTANGIPPGPQPSDTTHNTQ
ncbi:MAG: hypothetical protein MUF78_09705 [Candidatus Edwardsbacteria bacterium]|jgi:hypothetical protein|nr:hypothetical protein [Candidatus Edwardsbacteria bacterium]